MAVEMIAIGFQAARGVPSHFNVTSAFNGYIFTVMGIFIGINTLANFITLLLFFNRKIQIPRTTQIAWLFGLLLLFLGSISGGLMVAYLAHTMGAPDGGPGLPFVNWSTQASDIRVAHFFTLHGLQFIPLVWWLIAVRFQLTQKTWAVVSLSVIYLLMCLGLHWIALEGQPLIRL